MPERGAGRSGTVLAAALVALFAPGLAGCRALRPARDPAPRVRGPLPSRVHQPMAQTVMALRPRRARTLGPGELALDARLVYGSIEEVGASAETLAAFDGELARASLALRHGLGSGTDVELELGLLHSDRGILDGLIEGWHRFFGFPNGVRDERDRDRHEMRLVHRGEVLYELDEGRAGLTDLPIVFTHQLRGQEHGDLFLAARVGLEVPLGSERRGFGNGGLDLGAGLLAERSLGRWTLFGHADLVLPGQPRAFREAGVELAERISLGLGGELRWSERTSLLAQVTWISPVTRDLAPKEISTEILDLGLGLARDASTRSRWTFSFHEDLHASTGMDFKLLLAWTWSR